MRTVRDLADELVGLPAAEVYRRLVLFLVERGEQYSPVDARQVAQREYADRHGFFWLPCVLCNRWYGGHESGTGKLYLTSGGGVSTCPSCRSEAAALNTLYPDGMEHPT